MKILNPTIKIDVQNDEMTSEADTMLAEDALETINLVGAECVDLPRVRRMTNKQHRSTTTHASRVYFVSQLGDEVGVCRTGQG